MNHGDVIKILKLPVHRAGLPGHVVASWMRAKEISFTLCPLTPPIFLIDFFYK
jgi:hypothetical protein